MKATWLAFVAIAGCAPVAPPPAPPSPAPPAPPSGSVLVEAAPAAPSAAPEAPAPPPPPPAGPVTSMSLEEPFRLDRRVFPKSKEAFLADLHDRTAWNHGGLGKVEGELPPVPGHPAPKVIVDVVKVSGPHSPAEVQRVLRKMFWIQVVRCYGLGAYKDQKMRGVTSLRFGVSAAGKVTSAKLEKTTLGDAEVAACMPEKVKGIALPKAAGRSTVSIEVQVGPGTEPQPPPITLVEPGEGVLEPSEMRRVVEEARPEIEGCHREALAYAPELWGRIGARFHVTAKGKTDEVFEAESQFPDERVTLCVLHALRKLKFPKPEGGDLRFLVPIRLWSGRSALPPAPAK